MLRRTSFIGKPLVWAFSVGLSLGTIGCGTETTKTTPAPSEQPQANPASADQKSLSKAGKQKKFLDDEPTALEKRAARLKAAKGK